MKPKLKILLIGAGGVASYLLPVLHKTFDLSGMLFDKDLLEKKNLDRQLFDPKDIGKCKAEALISHVGCKGVLPVAEFFSEDTVIEKWNTFLEADFDVIISVADNHRARRDALEAGDKLYIPVFTGANELTTSQAFVYYPQWNNADQDPRVRYPEILTEDGESPLSCQALQESEPQLAIANQIASSFLLWLLWVWKDNEIFDHKAVEFQSTMASIQTVTFKDCSKK
tara:strand:+ start:1977 stop:2654 length:678 start_codon:yes stop_codon:yes gene_type:complete